MRTLRRGLGLGLCGLLAAHALPAAANPVDPQAAAFSALAGSLGPVALTAWIAATDVAQGRPFIIVDKRSARVFAFDAAGGLVGETAALIGVALRDGSPPGIGTMRLAVLKRI